MSKVACFIPIKEKSQRVKNKNLRTLNGKPLYTYVVDSVTKSEAFNSVYIDTDSEEIKEYCLNRNLNVIDRKPSLAQDNANGNDLLNYHYSLYPDFDLYFQLFATAPLLTANSIRLCVEALKSTKYYDSVFSAIEECGWFWFENKAINYDPKILPRSQDAKKVMRETTGLYGITRESLKNNRCRIGDKPLPFYVSAEEALDIDTELDFEIVKYVMEKNNVGF